MAKVELKQPIVDEIKAQLDGAKSMVVVDYRGISVADVTELVNSVVKQVLFIKFIRTLW